MRRHRRARRKRSRRTSSACASSRAGCGTPTASPTARGRVPAARRRRRARDRASRGDARARLRRRAVVARPSESRSPAARRSARLDRARRSVRRRGDRRSTGRADRRPRRAPAAAARAASLRPALVRRDRARGRAGRHPHQPRLPGALHVLRQLRHRPRVPPPLGRERRRRADAYHDALGHTFFPCWDDALTANRAASLRALRRVRARLEFPSRGARSRARTWSRRSCSRRCGAPGSCTSTSVSRAATTTSCAAIKKGIKTDQVVRALDLGEGGGLSTACNFMLGFPQEDAGGARAHAGASWSTSRRSWIRSDARRPRAVPRHAALRRLPRRRTASRTGGCARSTAATRRRRRSRTATVPPLLHRRREPRARLLPLPDEMRDPMRECHAVQGRAQPAGGWACSPTRSSGRRRVA